MLVEIQPIRLIGLTFHTDNTTGNGFSGAMAFTTWGGKNGTWDRTSNTTDVKIKIKLDGKSIHEVI